MSYDVRFSPRAQRDLRGLPHAIVTRVMPKVEALASEPRPPGCVKLSGERDIYRIRVGDYRVVHASTMPSGSWM